MSKAQFRRIIKGNWSNSDEQKTEDPVEYQQEQSSFIPAEEDLVTD
jgi:hypothetical protein